jgi:hypothetical protein
LCVIKRIAAPIWILGLVLLLMAAPAYAVELGQDPPIPSDSAEFQGSETECAEYDLEAGQVAWHFILNQSETDDQTLTVTFQNADTETYEPSKVVDAYVLHYDVMTGTDTLLSASTSGDTGNLRLSHICTGGEPPVIPEAPAASLLMLSAGLLGLGFMGWRLRKAQAAI